MKTITVRGLDEDTAKSLKRMAKDKGKSINQFILETLKDRLGLNKQKRYTVVHHDMDDLLVDGLKMSLNRFKVRLIRSVRSTRNSGNEKPSDRHQYL
jgi:hypothetical protein